MADLITPPDDLVRDWARFQNHEDPEALWRRIATLAARWGSNQELEACCEWLDQSTVGMADLLREYRRPKPPSLKEQALDDFNGLMQELDGAGAYSNCANRIRRALEALPE